MKHQDVILGITLCLGLVSVAHGTDGQDRQNLSFITEAARQTSSILNLRARRFGSTRQPAMGHRFGEDLSDKDKNALIAFLATL